jgi:putative cell wall-binding protein
MKKGFIALLSFIFLLSGPFQLSTSAAELPNQDLIVTAQGVDVYEQESNNTLVEADLFDFTDSVYGNVDGTDVDFFTVDVAYTGNLVLSGHAWSKTNNDIENYNGLLFSLFDEAGNLVSESEYFGPIDGVDYNIINTVVPPGTYYVGVENTKAELKDYVFFTDLQLGADRLYGASRYSTAVEISKAGWDTSNYAVLTTGGNFPDALSATPLAKKHDAPLLLTEPNSSKLNADVKAEIQRLQVKNVIIVGGTGAVSSGAEQELESLGITVTRLGGSTRYETAIKVAEELGHNGEIAVVTGKNFADALSMSAIAASVGMPIILTEQSSLPASVQSYISNNTIGKSYVIGGSAVVSDSVTNSLPGAVRIFGSDRYATNKAILDAFVNSIDFSFVFVATGSNYPDAISGSALAARLGGPIVLTSSTPSIYTKEIITKNNMQIGSITALGGTAAVSNSAVNALIDLGNPGLTRYYLE